jgi:hypothetical protein
MSFQSIAACHAPPAVFTNTASMPTCDFAEIPLWTIPIGAGLYASSKIPWPDGQFSSAARAYCWALAIFQFTGSHLN